MSRAKKSIADTFSRAYAEASPEEQAALRVWMGNIIRPQKAPCVNMAKARRFEKPIEARDLRILEFPLSTSSETVAEILKAEGPFTIPSPS